MSVEGSGKRAAKWQDDRSPLIFSMKKRAYLKNTRMAKLFTMLTTSQVRRLQKKAPSAIKEKINVAIAMVGRSVGGPATAIPKESAVPMAVTTKATFITGSAGREMGGSEDGTDGMLRVTDLRFGIGQWSISATRMKSSSVE